jgi:Nuclease-related domain
MLFGRRLSEEQRALREQANAEESVGRVLDRLTRVGDRVLHDRRAPVGHGQVDHIVITPAGVHFIETLPVSERRQFWIDKYGSPRLGQLPLRQRLEHMVDLAGAIADQTNTTLHRPRGLLVYPLVAVVGASTQRSTTAHRVDLVSVDLVPSWLHRLPAMHDLLDVAAITEAVAQLCPHYQAGR